MIRDKIVKIIFFMFQNKSTVFTFNYLLTFKKKPLVHIYSFKADKVCFTNFKKKYHPSSKYKVQLKYFELNFKKHQILMQLIVLKNAVRFLKINIVVNC